MKNLLAGEQQAAVTVAVEALMDAKPESESFATFDPKVCLCSNKVHLHALTFWRMVSRI